MSSPPAHAVPRSGGVVAPLPDTGALRVMQRGPLWEGGSSVSKPDVGWPSAPARIAGRLAIPLLLFSRAHEAAQHAAQPEQIHTPASCCPSVLWPAWHQPTHRGRLLHNEEGGCGCILIGGVELDRHRSRVGAESSLTRISNGGCIRIPLEAHTTRPNHPIRSNCVASDEVD